MEGRKINVKRDRHRLRTVRRLMFQELIARAYQAGPEPGIDPAVLLKRWMLKDRGIFLWTLEMQYGKPKQKLEHQGSVGIKIINHIARPVREKEKK